MNHPNRASEPQQLARGLLGGLALMLAIVGQVWLYSSLTGLWPGLILSLMALVLFVAGSVYPPPGWVIVLVTRLSLSYEAVMVGMAVALAILATVVDVVWQELDRANYVPVLIVWAGSALAYMAAFARSSFRWEDARAWLRAHRSELIGIGLITLAAAFLRFYQLGSIPRVINGDEGRIGQYALATHQNPLANPFVLIENLGSLYLQAIGISLYALGQTPFALRLLPAIGGTLAVPALYLLGRQLFGTRVAFLAALLLALAHAHIHFSRIVAVAYIHGTWLVPLELYFFLSGLQQRSPMRLALGGLILGAHFNIYLTAQIVAALLLVYLLVAARLCRPLIQQAARRVWVFWLGAFLTALPTLAYAWRNPTEFFARLNVEGTFQSGWLANTMAETGRSAAPILLERVLHAFLSLNYHPAIDFYGSRIPLLDLTSSTLFVLGLGYALWRTRDARYLLLNGYFWSMTVSIGLFSIPPSADSYRMLAALPAAVLLAAVGLDQILVLLSLNELDRRIVRVGMSAFVVVAVLALNLRAYFFDFAQRCRYGGDPQTRFASYLGNYLRTLNRETSVYLLNDDVLLYGTHSSVDFLSNNLPVTNVPDPATSLQSLPKVTIISVPSRMGELQDWATAHPGGSLHREYDCDNLMLLAYQMP
jgi:4-amino-4-deoxy-L-arabinose transferase-like glycosyltransferase